MGQNGPKMGQNDQYAEANLLKLQDEVVNVKLPKFKMQDTFQLLDPLKSLGLVDLIDKETADLGLMAPTDTLQLSSFTHK